MTIYDELKTAASEVEAKFLKSINTNHSGLKGSFRECIISDIIRPFLPKRYGLTTGESFDSAGNTSKQLDVVVYDDLFSYAIPYSNYHLLPIESVYGVIEVKSKLDKKEFDNSISNIASLKRLHKEPVDECQILPNLSIDITNVHWNESGFTTPFGCIFAYSSAKPETVTKYFCKTVESDLEVMPDMIVLFDKRTIIMRICYVDDKFYATTSNTYQGYIPLFCGEDTLPIFLMYLMCRTNDTRLKLPKISTILNSVIAEKLHAINKVRPVKYPKRYEGKN